jgi:DNA helicase-2/ATP-dependent DNA helicase PcrA
VGTTRGEETWTQAGRRTRAALRRLTPDLDTAPLAAELLVGNQSGRRRSVQVMNLHQTKGREADTTILLLGADENHGSEAEPFPDGSRLLYVVMTRARHRAHIVVPATSHRLWRHLVDAVEYEAGSVSPCGVP